MRVVFYAVLKSGGEFKPEHAFRLFRQILRHTKEDVALVLFTDKPEDVCVATPDDLRDKFLIETLKYNWPGWWSKMEMFATSLGYPVIYFDLDTTIVGDLTPLIDEAQNTRLGILEDFYRGAGTMQSSAMTWNLSGFTTRLFRAFSRDPEQYMAKFKTGGDQAFLEAVLHKEYVPRFQKILPGAFISYKANNVAESGVPDGAIAVIFHGKPRPWDPGVKNVDRE